MNDDPRAPRSASPPAPFSTPSYEPRFAIEHRRLDALSHALRLHAPCNNETYGDDAPVFVGYTLSPARVAVAARVRGFPSELRMHGYEPLFKGLTQAGAVEAIFVWLRDVAEFPERPCFEGGEGRGFRAYHVAWGQESLGPYGYLVVEPTWFEIHK